MGLKNWFANKIMNWLSENADDGDAQVNMKGQNISVKELRKIQSEWERDGLIQ